MITQHDEKKFQTAIASLGMDAIREMKRDDLKALIKKYRTDEFPIIKNLGAKKDELIAKIEEHYNAYLATHKPAKYIKRDDLEVIKGEAAQILKSIVPTVGAHIQKSEFIEALDAANEAANRAFRLVMKQEYEISSLGSISSDITALAFPDRSSPEVTTIIRVWQPLFKGFNRETSLATAQLVSDRRKNQRPMPDVFGIYAWVRTVLERPQDYSGVQVSIALALATGRRMAEIHSTARFSPVDGNDYAAMFYGQLKKSGESRGLTYEIPLLIPFELVDAGLKYLGDIGQRIIYDVSDWDDNKKKAVNTKFAMAFTRAIAKVRTSILYSQNKKAKGFEDLSNPNPLALLNLDLHDEFPDLQPVAPSDSPAYRNEAVKIRGLSTTYHNARTIYANLCYSIFTEGELAKDIYLTNILGHSDREDSVKNTFRNYDFFITRKYDNLSIDDFVQNVEQINGDEWLRSEVEKANQK